MCMVEFFMTVYRDKLGTQIKLMDSLVVSDEWQRNHTACCLGLNSTQVQQECRSELDLEISSREAGLKL